MSDAPKPHAIDLPAKRPAPPVHQPAAIEMSPRDAARAQQRRLDAERVETLELHHIDGRVEHIPARPRPLPATPSRSGPPAPAIGEHPHLQKLLGDAIAKDPQAASDPRFRARLDKCLGLRPTDLMSWGKTDLDVLSAAADTQAQIAKRLGTIDAARIADECRTAATKPPTLIERMTKSNRPAFFKQTLGTARTLLDDLTREVVAAGETLRPKLASLRLDILALEIASTVLTDAMAQATAAGRLRTLVSGQQLAAMALQTFDNMQAANLKLVQDIDQLLTVVIPGWTLAQ